MNQNQPDHVSEQVSVVLSYSRRNVSLQAAHYLLSRLRGMISRNKILFLVFVISIIVESSIKLQNSSAGLFGTSDEWTVYDRARFLSEYFRLPVNEPSQIPLNPIV